MARKYSDKKSLDLVGTDIHTLFERGNDGKGRWLAGFQAQDEMLDGFMKKYNLEKMDWRPAMYQDLQKN